VSDQRSSDRSAPIIAFVRVLSAAGDELAVLPPRSLIWYGAGQGYLTSDAATTILRLLAPDTPAATLNELPSFALAVKEKKLVGCRIYELDPGSGIVRFTYAESS
jgi:hypothetical protein